MSIMQDLLDRIDILTAKRNEIANELKPIITKAKQAGTKNLDDGQLTRARNLRTGLERCEAELRDAQSKYDGFILDGLKSGRFHAEAGVDGGPEPYFGGSSATAPGLGRLVNSAGFNLKSRPSVEVSGWKALKASTFPSTEADWSRRGPQLVAMGYDTRFLWPWLPREDAGTDTGITDFKQTGRTVTGTVQRALDATTDKAVLDVVTELVVEPLAQHAVILEDIPNAIIESVPKLDAYLAAEGQFQVEKSIDTHVLAQVVAASPPFGTSGSTLVEKVRNGIATMRATGANPTLLVLNPTDAAALDLTTDAGGFVFPTSASGSSSPLWGLRVVERAGAGNEPPYLIDPAMLGVLYIGSMHFDANPYSKFKKNLTDVRIEVNALFHVRNANGARRIAAS